MAESAVNFLLEQLATLIKEERQLLGGLHGKVQNIEGQLRLMQAFLRVADAKEDSDPELKEWVKQVREFAYDAEDVLDMFMLRFGHLRVDGFLGCFKVYATVKNYGARRNVALQLREMESRAKNTYEKHLSYIRKYETDMNASSSNAGIRKFDGRSDARHVEENMLVGIEGPKEELINQLLDGESHLKAISVIGMGGLGKSTLVNSIYKDKRVKEQFQCHAWVTISQVYKIEELLRKLIRQLCVEVNEPLPQSFESLDHNELKICIRDFLRERSYVLVLDDIWSQDSWDDIRHVLPNSKTSSRVLLTTRVLDVANATSVEYLGYVYKMKALSFKESMNLFYNTVFKDKICPQHLEDVAERILAKCEGLPLAILAIGGLLASKDSISEWKMVLNDLNSELDGKLERVKHVILLSYYDLPYYLKSCLLYFSILPEDDNVRHYIIIQLWTAEGLVKGSENRNAEEVGAGYLNELISRNLVLECEMDIFEDSMEAICGIHDIVREVIVSKSREQNFVSTKIGLSSEVRRLAIHSSIDNTFEANSLKHLRSIVILGHEDSVTKQFLNDLLAGSHRLLKVLHLERWSLKEIPNEIFKLSLLTYLNLSYSKVKVIPKSIDADQMRDTSIVKEIGKLTQLKMLGICKLRREDGKDLCSSLNKLSHLHELFVSSIADHEILPLDCPLSSIPRFLKRLALNGRLEKNPQWIPSLQELIDLQLCSSKLRDDPLELLGDLPNLKNLELTDAYEGATLHFKAGKFCSLKYLIILHMKKLRSIVVEEDSMASLVTLRMGHCEIMVELPIGLEHLTQLKLFQVHDMKDAFVEELENGKRREISSCTHGYLRE